MNTYLHILTLIVLFTLLLIINNLYEQAKEIRQSLTFAQVCEIQN